MGRVSVTKEQPLANVLMDTREVNVNAQKVKRNARINLLKLFAVIMDNVNVANVNVE